MYFLLVSAQQHYAGTSGGPWFIHETVFDMRQRGLTLDTKECKVDTIGISGATTVELIIPLILHQIQSQNYKLLVLDIGSNDLESTRQPNINTGQLARELVNQKQDIGRNYGFGVIICLPTLRAESKFPGSFKITKAFHKHVSTMAESKTHVHVWVHKGVFKTDTRYLDRHGVHPNFRGTVKYFYSIQVAVCYHAVRL